MFNNTRKRFYNWLKNSDSDRNHQVNTSNIKTSTIRKDDDLCIDSRGILFKVMPGSGGIAIEIRHYDQRSDTQTSILHIIPENEDLSEALAKIITLESMRR